MSLDGFVPGPNQSVDNPLGSSACAFTSGRFHSRPGARCMFFNAERSTQARRLSRGWGATLSSSHVACSGCHRAAVAGQAHALLGCTFLFVLHHVNELPQWIANVETAHTPRFALGAVFNWQACFPDPCESYLDVINLD